MSQILVGDSLESLGGLPCGIAHTCVTSPPYFGLRDYGVEGQIGLEETPDAYVTRLVGVFREVRRVLRDDGTLWLNLGDSYSRQGGATDNKNPARELAHLEGTQRRALNKPIEGYKSKDLMGIPWKVAFALQSDGWYLRQDIIWHKPNPMPESVTDRCTKAHEYLFLLSKSERYYFDAAVMKEPAESLGRAQPRPEDKTETPNNTPWLNNRYALGASGFGHGKDGTRNRRSVWTVATQPYSGAHFATFPTELIRPCILAGAPEGGTVLDPFGGSGTTAQVSVEEGREFILCELNPEYIPLIKQRVRDAQPKLVPHA